MKTTNAFRRNWLSTTSIAIAFVLVGMIASAAILHLTWRSNSSPPIFIAEMIGEREPADRARALAELRALHGPPPGRDRGDQRAHPEITLLEASGTATYPSNSKLGFAWQDIALPKGEYESTKVPSALSPSAAAWIVRLPGAPQQFLLIDGFMGGLPPSPLRALAITISCLLVSMLLGIGGALSLLFRSLEGKVRLVDGVMAQLRAGDLKARLPIKKMDDVGQAMHRFNLMAEEIERLVDGVRNAEGARTRLLQELAHDLRTPIAALRSSIETLSETRRLEPGMREELFTISRREIEYLHRLVDDLLALANVADESYRTERRSVSLRSIVDEEAAAAEMKRRREPSAPRLHLELPDEDVAIFGDPHLLRRMIRNGLDNAFDFAKSDVRVTIATDETSAGGAAIIEIADDGAGLSPEALIGFGARRLTRSLDENRAGRISIGLGSVIMKAVAEAHRGSVDAQNAPEGGARVRIRLPRAT